MNVLNIHLSSFLQVIEVNASHTRNGASIKKLISEAAQSAHIMDNMSGNAGTATGPAGSGAAVTEMNLILFDEVRLLSIAHNHCNF